jgi:glutaredoxin-like protein NrdH
MTTAQTLTPALTVTVYTSPSCVQCKQTKRHLEHRGIAFTEEPFDDESRDAAIYLGFKTAPVIIADHPEYGELSWDGYRPDRIDALIR